MSTPTPHLTNRRGMLRLVLAVVLIVAGLVLLGTGLYWLAGTAGLVVLAGLVMIVAGALLPW
jgi:hypothetical protein